MAKLKTQKYVIVATNKRIIVVIAIILLFHWGAFVAIIRSKNNIVPVGGFASKGEFADSSMKFL